MARVFQFVMLGLLAVLMPWFSPAALARPDNDRVLVLASYQPGHFWQQGEVDGAVGRLRKARTDLRIDVEYLDLVRFGGPERHERIVPALLKKYGPDVWKVVLLLDQSGLDFGLKYRPALFPNAAFVFCGVEDFSPEKVAANPFVTGVIEKVDPAANARLALTLQPGLKRLVVISGDSGGLAHVDEINAVLPFQGAKPEVELFKDFNSQELYGYLDAMPDGCAIVFSGFSQSQIYIRELQRWTRVPLYALHWPTYNGLGMGGVMIDATFQGEDAADMALQILEGASPASIPVKRAPRFRTVVDSRMLQKFGIPESRIPEGCEVLNRPAPLWKSHRKTVLATGGALGFLAASVFGLVLILGQKHRAEQALKRSERRFRHLVEDSDDMIVELDRSARIGYASPNSMRWLGYEPARLQGSLLDDLGHPAEIEKRARILSVPGIHRLRLKHRDGSWRWMEFSIRAPDSDLESPVTVAVLRDVTDRVEAEEAQKETERQMRQAEKMRALGTLAGGIAHDFNNLLTPILGHASLLEDRATDPVARESAREIQAAATRAGNIVKGILTFGRAGAEVHVPVHLGAVIDDARRLLRSSLPSAVFIETRAPAGLPAILADSTRIEQLLLNLGQNAAHAMPDGGRLTITADTENVGADFATRHPPLRPGTKVVLSVTDTGCGMDAETARHVFEPFFTTKPPGKGTGLGLSIVFGIVRDHDAAITFDTAPGKGTAFRIYFEPVAAEPAAETPAQPSKLRGKGESILVLDDEPSVGRVGQAMLRRLGYQAELVLAPEELLARLSEPSRPSVALVISDLNMPGMNGVQLLQVLRQRHPEIPVVLTTGQSSESITADFDGFLPKPYSIEDLGAIVFDCLYGQTKKR